MEIQIIKEKRRTLSLQLVNENLAVLKAPKSLSNLKIQDFLDSKRNWLAKQTQLMQKRKDFAKRFDVENFIYQNGQKVALKNDLFSNFSNLPKSKQSLLVRNFYLKQFQTLKTQAKHLAEKHGIQVREIVPVSSVRVWGSFNREKCMKLNWKLSFLPNELSEYVIMHELCHGRHMNHSPRFWAEVEKLCPNFKQLDRQLEMFGFVLRNPLLRNL